MTFVEKLARLGACDEAMDWVFAQPKQDGYSLWRTCPRGDWLGWLLVDVDYSEPTAGLLRDAWEQANEVSYPWATPEFAREVRACVEWRHVRDAINHKMESAS